jgi:hypothetical protein
LDWKENSKHYDSLSLSVCVCVCADRYIYIYVSDITMTTQVLDSVPCASRVDTASLQANLSVHDMRVGVGVRYPCSSLLSLLPLSVEELAKKGEGGLLSCVYIAFGDVRDSLFACSHT